MMWFVRTWRGDGGSRAVGDVVQACVVLPVLSASETGNQLLRLRLESEKQVITAEAGEVQTFHESSASFWTFLSRKCNFMGKLFMF